jgi:hypothetical protein
MGGIRRKVIGWCCALTHWYEGSRIVILVAATTERGTGMRVVLAQAGPNLSVVQVSIPTMAANA